jgi:hypothetical protein
VLDGTVLLERALRFGNDQLAEHAAHGIEGERTGGQLDLTGRRDDVGAFAYVEDESIAVGANDRGE